MKYKNEIKSQKGSITLYVLISMMFFLIIILGIYFNSSNKVQKQEEEIEKIQKEYEKNNINDIYEEIYNDYVNTETPTIQAYDGDTLKSEVIGEKVSSRKTIYLANEKVKLKFLSKNTNDKYAYSTTANGEKTKIEGNTLDIDITTSGKTIYVYIEDNNGNYSKNYTAVTMILVTLQDKTIYIEEGKDTKIGKIQGENAGEITFGQVEDSTIIKLDGDTITGLKAGTTTLIATEGKAGATATITVKVVKIELASTSGTILIGDSRTVKITGTNNGTLSVKSSDEETAIVSLNNNEIIITAKKAGNATITVTESNVKATATYEIKVASVTLTPNGGTYTMPTEGNATIKTTVTTENAEKIETAWSDNAGEWSVIENNKLVEKTDCTNGTYYLYVRINGEAIYKSKEFIVGENTLESNKITIKPSTTAWTKGNVTATVTYGSTLTANKKAGYGTTLANAQTAASTSTATSLTATANGYFYAEATDAAGNKVTASLQVSNIDKTLPTVTLSPNGGTYTMPTSGNATIKTTLTASDTGGSGLKTLQYAWSTSNMTAPTTWTTFTSGSTVSKTDCEAGTYYLWTNVIDNAGNTATTVRTSNAFKITADKITITPNTTNWTNGNITATVTYGSTLTANKKAGYGTTLANAQTAASTSTATSLTATANGYFYAEATDAAGNKVTASLQITKIDKTLPTVTLSPNGGTYTIPTGGTTATIKTTLKASDTGGSGLKTLQYAWSTSNTTAPTTWTTFTSGSTVNKTDCTAGTYYLWTNVIDNAGNTATSVRTSNSFTVKANTDATSKITITPSTTNWTNGNITATVTYGSTLTANKKAGYGTTLANAQTAASTSTATSLTATANGYFYAEATDAAGNKVTASLQVTKIDKTGPTINSVTTETEYNYSNSATINATDSQSGIVAYAVTTSSTAPTTWIETKSVDLAGAQTKYEYDAAWARVFYHNNINGSILFASDTEALSVNSKYKFSILEKLDNYKNSNNQFEFLLQYPNNTTQYNRWIQTDNPATVTVANGTGSETAAGYSAVHVDWTGNYWGGLTKSTSTATFINGSVGHSNWYYAIGSKTKHGVGIPSYNSSTTATEVELWTRIDTLTKQTKTTISSIVGNLRTNGTYYAWVKDALGNTSSKQFTVSKVDNTAPTISNLAASTTAWTNQNVTLTVTANDGEAGLHAESPYGWNSNTTWTNSKTSTVSANGTYTVYVRNALGNVASKQIEVSNIDKTVPTVTLSPNGGTYTMPTSGNATIKTTLTASDTGGSGLKTLQYAWSTSNTTAPTTWTTFTSGSTVSKTDCTAGTYYLWTNVIDNAGNTATNVRTSSSFTVKANTDATSKITITPSTTAWTNQDITATVTYGSTLTANKKAGYGATLANAKTAASTSTATSVTITANGYVFASATDAAGNLVTASLQITNIDKTAPAAPSVSAVYKVVPGYTGYKVYNYKTWSSQTDGKIYCENNGDAQIQLPNVNTYLTGVKGVYIGLSDLSEITCVQVFYKKSGESYSETNSVKKNVSKGDSDTFIEIPTDNYEGIRVDIGVSNETYKIGSINLIATSGQKHTSFVRGLLSNTDTSGSKFSHYQYKVGTGSWTDLTGNLQTNTTVGSYTVYYRVVDKAGNVSSEASMPVNIVEGVASVDGIYYSSLANAINAISSSGTITMLKDTTESPTIPSGKTITLNLNSKTVTGRLTNNGTVNISGGTIYWNGNGNALLNKGTATLSSGTLSSVTGWTIENSGTFNMTGGEVKITGSNATGSAAIMNVGTMSMSSGTITSTGYGLVTRGTSATTTVTGGTITSTNTSGSTAVKTDEGGTTKIYNTKISGNKIASKDANGTSVAGKRLWLINCTISGSGMLGNGILEVQKNSTGYSVYYYNSSSSRVRFPTWTANNGQDDLIWHEGVKGTRYGSTVWYYNVKKSEHKNESGKYNTHIYIDSSTSATESFDIDI